VGGPVRVWCSCGGPSTVGPDPDLKDNEGHTALAHAQYAYDTDICSQITLDKLSGYQLKARATKLVKVLDTDGNGKMDAGEVRVFVAHMLDRTVESVPEDHPDVQDLVGKTTDEFIEALLALSDADIMTTRTRSSAPKDANQWWQP